MRTTLVDEIAQGMNAAGIPPDFGPERSALLIRVLRTLACGRPISVDQVDKMAADIGLATQDAHQFLEGICERDDAGRIVGTMGLSLNGHWAHQFYVNGTALRTWCAWDTLFLPALLKRTASIVSFSPGSKKEVRVTVSPAQVEWTCPKTAVVSIVNLVTGDQDNSSQDTPSIEAIWSNFCHQVYFFPTAQEAEEWAEDKENISILSVEEAYELGKQAFSKLLSYA